MSVRTLLAGAALALLTTAASAETSRWRHPRPPRPDPRSAKPIAAKKGLDIQIVEFSDYVVPNTALESGELQANSFQHQPYLDNQVKDRGYKIVSVATTVNFPIGIYSKKFKSFDDLPVGATVAIPNDPTNGGRVLLLLERQGLHQAARRRRLQAQRRRHHRQSEKLKIVEIDAAQLPRSLPDVDAAGINTNYAKEAGLDPVKDPILREDPKGRT